MKTLEELRQYISEEVGYVNWDTLVEVIKGSADLITFYTDMVATAYADQALEEAADNVELLPQEQYSCEGCCSAEININSILSIKEQLK